MLQVKDKIRIGILRGGIGENYNSSIRRGGDIISHIHENLSGHYKPVDILVDKDGVWHLRGMPVTPEKLLYKVDAVWNVSHSRFSNILESFSIPSIGVPPFSPFFQHSSDNLESRKLLEDHIKKIGIKMPKNIILPLYQRDFDGPEDKYAMKKAKEVFEKFGSPWIVKSYTVDKTMGIHLAKTFPELVRAIEDGVNHEKSILVEEFIPGLLAPVHSVSGFRGSNIYVFPPGNFSKEEKEKLVSTAKDLYDHIGARHYLRSDFVLTPRGQVYLLGLELVPDLNQDSHFHQACVSVGARMDHVVRHLLEQVLK